MQEEREQRRHLRSQMEQMGMEKEALDRIAPLIDNPYLHGTGEYDNDPNTTNIYLSNLSLEVGNFPKYSCLKLLLSSYRIVVIVKKISCHFTMNCFEDVKFYHNGIELLNFVTDKN